MKQGLVFTCARGRLAALFLCGLASWGLCAQRSFAQNRTWSPIPIDSDWLNDENWVPQGIPTSAEMALISHSGNYDVKLSESQTIGGLTLGGSQGVQTLTLDSGSTLTVDPGGNVQVQGTGVLVLDDASVMGPVLNHASVRMQQAMLSSLLAHDGLLEAVDSANAVVGRPVALPQQGVIRVRADSSPASLTYGNSQLPPLPLGNFGRIELLSTGGLPATFDLVGGNLEIQDTGVVVLSGDAGAAVVDAPAVSNLGLLTGHGDLTGDLLSDARVVVGPSPGTLKVGGQYTQSSVASLAVEIAGADAGSQYSVLDVAATADLGGLLMVDFLGDFAPDATDDFSIIRRMGGSGEFDTIQVSGLSQHGYSIRYETDAVIMNFLSGDDILSGDYNGNFQVEQADLDLVLLNWGAEGRTPIGWVNDLPDGSIDQNELDRVLLNWGDTSAGGLAASGGVPEPSTWMIAMLVAALIPLIRRA